MTGVLIAYHTSLFSSILSRVAALCLARDHGLQTWVRWPGRVWYSISRKATVTLASGPNCNAFYLMYQPLDSDSQGPEGT